MKTLIAKALLTALPRSKPEGRPHWLTRFNFEFMDLENVPNSLKYTLRDILDVGSSTPFRGYNRWVASCIYEYSKKKNITNIVELGAGGAPITRHLIKQYSDWDVTFTITDLNPDALHFKKLEQADKRVRAILEPVDFSKKLNGFENSLLVLSAAFHHIPEENKKNILAKLKSISPHVMIFEPVCPNSKSILMNFGILFTGLATPLFKLNSKSIFRNLFWCWLFPIAPLLLLWDGNISAMRCWSKAKWLSQEPKAEVTEYATCAKMQIV